MKNFKILFKDFLNNKRVYHLNQNFWKNALKKPVAANLIQQENWYVTQYANGTKMYDGNPIYSILLNGQKSVRIIQEAPESPSPEISAWVHPTEDTRQQPIEELVIVLELSKETKKIALDFISYWVQEKTDIGAMKALIDATLENMVQA